MDQHAFPSPDCSLNVATSPGLGTPIVLLHGVTRCWKDFAPVLPALVHRWRAHALDFRGHGRSGRVAGQYRVVDYVRDVVAFLRQGLVEPAIIYGHSLGGMVAMACAAEAPERVRALVLEDPPMDMMGGRLGEVVQLDMFRAYARYASSPQSVDEIAADLAEALVTPPGGSAAFRLGDIRDATALRFHASCLKRVDPDVLTPILERKWLDGFDVESQIRRIVCPTLFVQGDTSAGGMLPDEYAAALVAMLPRGLLVKLKGVGHNIHWLKTDDMIRLTLGFLESLDD
jgi:pimeloyl-ACP methyl ester carboxylesterase